MSAAPEPTPPTADFPLRRQDQGTLVALAALGLLLLAGQALWLMWGPPRWILWRDQPRQPAVMLVDLNRASWPELAMLPRIGETLARRIVADRAEYGPFRSVDELQRVHGIGPKTVAGLREHVRPIE